MTTWRCNTHKTQREMASRGVALRISTTKQKQQQQQKKTQNIVTSHG
jgi:hypothetical protein